MNKRNNDTNDFHIPFSNAVIQEVKGRKTTDDAFLQPLHLPLLNRPTYPQGTYLHTYFTNFSRQTDLQTPASE